MEKSVNLFFARLATVAAAGAIMLGVAGTANADPITIGGVTIDAPAEVAGPVNTQIAAIDQALGQTLPVSLPETAVNVGEAAFGPIDAVFHGAHEEEGSTPPVREPLSNVASLSQQWDQATGYFVPEYIAPDATSCTESGVLDDQIACASSNVNDFYASNGYGEGPQAVLVPEFGAGFWFNPDTQMFCGYVSGMGTHQCDGRTYYDRVAGPLASDNQQTAVAIHESGHDRQETSGSLDPVGVSLPAMVGINPSAVFPLEQGSDCFAGAYYNQGLANGTVTTDQANEAHDTFGDIGVEGEKSHGGPQERRDAFANGLYGGASACNAFTPGVIVY